MPRLNIEKTADKMARQAQTYLAFCEIAKPTTSVPEDAEIALIEAFCDGWQYDASLETYLRAAS